MAFYKNCGENMDNLELLRLAEEQDVEAYEAQDFEETDKDTLDTYKQKYTDYYDDVKQPSKYIKEDW